MYRVLDDVRRSWLHQMKSEEEPLCDDLLPPGWYRFMENGASRTLATSCPGEATQFINYFLIVN